MSEVNEKRPLPARIKGAVLHQIRQRAKDILLFQVLPTEYRRAAKQPIEPGKVVFLENKEADIPESFEVLYERLGRVPELDLRFISLGETRVRLRQYYQNCIEAVRQLATAQCVFLNDASNVVSCLPLREGTTVVQLWHGCGAFKKWGMSTADLIFGGSRTEILRHPFYKNLSLVTVSSPEVVWAYEEAMVLQKEPGVVQPTGVSRTDVFFDGEYLQKSREKLLSLVPAAEGKRVIVYAPTFRGRVAQAEGPTALDIAAMKQAMGEDAVLLIKHHPFVRELPAIPDDCRDFAFDVTRDIAINELICSADAVISDYSSLVFEYSLFGRPMVFFAFDQEEYADWRGFYYDYDALTPGPVCTSTEEVIRAVLESADNFDSSEVDAFRERFMCACDGRATDRIIEFALGKEVLAKSLKGQPMTAIETCSGQQPLVSVIIPVYNKASYIADCFACLEGQTIDKDAIEVLLINDGPTDNSLELCETFASKHLWARVLSQPNAGVSEARNAGIRAAQGRFMFFLDPDDTISPETLENVAHFFESCPVEVDLVTYPIVAIRDGKRQRMHHRYSVLDKTGVYDLTQPENATIAQATMNIAVRNRFGDNVLFDFHPANGIVIHEDEKYCTDILQRSMMLGFCDEAEYRWMRNDEGVTTTSMQPEFLYDNNLSLFEDFFGRYSEGVPPYIQGLLVNDIAWKLKSRIMLPTHLQGREYDEALSRLGRLLERVDDDLILRHPNLKDEYRLFVLSLKRNVPLRWLVAPGAMAVMRGENLVYADDSANAILTRIAVRDGVLYVKGRIESPFFAGYGGDIELMLCHRSQRRDRAVSSSMLELAESAQGYYDGKIKVNEFYDFEFACDLGESEDVFLDLRLDGASIPLRWTVKELARSAYALRNTRIVEDWRVQIDLEKSKIVVDNLKGKAMEAALKQLDGRVPRWKTRLDRRLIRNLAKDECIWVYADGPNGTDEDWRQFVQDAQLNDGITRYYADCGQGRKAPGRGKTIPFGSRQHKMLFCAAKKIVVSDTDYDAFAPMPMKSLLDFADFFNAEIVRLRCE
ncbi:CDP-glycerol glycerophosphotransferase family protein [Adlercreutzia muris]|uniref:CDP-glycerol glycerophosphotransferase family protein n=1 Tax=Adlercreutzia muris TaxID=1796610 RepID=UPI001365AAEA|nr:CDP-glycerol glycerophosphotransferase family protein [Adlercreutzia muris]NCA32188.1 glycosyltransferase [Adlercreutzia muris]